MPFDIFCVCLNFFQVLVQNRPFFLEYYQGFGNCHDYFGYNSILLMFPIRFQSEACFLKVYFLFGFSRLWIRKLRDLDINLWFLCYQYREGLIEFLQLIVLGYFVFDV